MVIVVEDELLIRMDAADELRHSGFEVLEAGNANEAIDLLNLHHWTIAVLFTDVHMPGEMDGLELAHHASTHWPWIAVLIASGHARLTESDLPLKSRFLPKPYEVRHMATHVRELADA